MNSGQGEAYLRQLKLISAAAAVLVMMLAGGDAQAVLPVGGGIDMTAIDPNVNACQNFYRHACGGFIANAMRRRTC